jgi:hypothetical protein
VVTVIWWLSAAGRVARALSKAHDAAAEAKTKLAKIDAQVRIAQLEARRDALAAGGGGWISPVVQALWAAPFVIYTWKLIVFDKVLALGATDPLGEFERWTGTIIIGFYFLKQTGGDLIDRARQVKGGR